ncbi:MAG TPA: gamma-glutamyltransferase [Steroidobacteraceae bacterium]|nr:gamma-glutamyltransferase [Steroidobacteraceae bacterium]
MKARSPLLALLILIAVALVRPVLGAPRPPSDGEFAPVHARHGMVASSSGLASAAGVEVMREGGNAIDAAVATGFALAVVHPQAGNLGGGGFMLIRLRDGTAHFIDYRETAPGKATATMYQDASGNVIRGLSTVGYKAIGVPGSVKGLVYAERHFGKLGLAKVMAPAIRLARAGYALSFGDAGLMSRRDSRLAQFPDSRRVFQNGGKGWHQGDIFRQPELALTLERIERDPNTLYTGAMARELADFMQKGGGLITAKDLADYRVLDRKPVTGTYRGLTVISSPPPSSGGIVLIELLNILEGYDLKSAGLNSAASIHLITEAYRRAFFDRAVFMGDPAYTDSPMLLLLDKRYATAWRGSILPEEASPSLALQRPTTFPQLTRFAAAHPILKQGPESHQTTHYSVVDSEGNAVAVTTTLNAWYGSGVTAGHLGFLLNDEMDDFAAKVGVPNMFGILQGSANAVGPGKRPLSSMTPTIVLKGGKLWLVLGSPGGPTIITTVANILIDVADYGLNIQQAVAAPRFHQQWMPDQILMEPDRFSPDTLRLLGDHGYRIAYGDRGDAECIEVDPATGELLGASDPRTELARAVGY